MVYWWPETPTSALASEAKLAGLEVKEFWMAGPVRQARVHGWFRGWGHWWQTNLNAFRAMRSASRGKRTLGLTLLHSPWYAELMILLSTWGIRKAAAKFFTATEWPLPPHKKLAYALSSALLDRLVVNSEEAWKFAVATGHIFGKKSILRDVDVLASQMNPAEADGVRIRNEHAIPLDAPVVGIVGRLDPNKGHPTLLEAWPRVLESHPDAHLLVVGGSYKGSGDSYPKELEALASELGLSGSVHFTGMREDVADHYAAMSVLAHPSHYDLFPFTILEAMGMGLPIVASRVGGIPDMVKHERDGLLIEPNNPEAWGNALSGLLGNPEQINRMGKAARKRVKGKWTVERATSSTLRLYNDFLEGKWIKDYGR